MNSDFRGYGVENALTGIPTRIHSVAAKDEVELAQIEAFLDTMAEVAISIAKRASREKEGVDVSTPPKV